MPTPWDDEGDTRLENAHAALAASDHFEPLSCGGEDEALWADCVLASLAENRLGDTTDPRVLDDARRSLWVERATTEKPWKPSRRVPYDRLYWLRESGMRVGTVALAGSVLGGLGAKLSSFYLFSEYRKRGIGKAA